MRSSSFFSRRNIQCVLSLLGTILSICGVCYVALRLRAYIGQIEFSGLNRGIWFWLGIGSIVCGGANFLLGVSWSYLLRFLGADTQMRWAVSTYGISQLAKYVPGNVMHLVGRQALGMGAGIKGSTVARSLVWELGLIAFVGALFGFLTLPLVNTLFSEVLAMILFFLVTTVVGFGLNLRLGQCISKVFCIYIFFLAINGFVFTGVLKALADGTLVLGWAPLCGSYVIAWLIGLVTPGAPAGVGVREMVLLFFLQGSVPKEILLFAIVLGRIVTVIGDVLYFCISVFLKKNCKQEEYCA